MSPPPAGGAATRRLVARSTPSRAPAASARGTGAARPDDRRRQGPAERRKPDLTVVPRGRRGHRARRRFLAPWLAGILLVGSLLAVVVGHTIEASGQVRLFDDQAALQQEQAYNRQLEASVATLEAPQRVVDDATSQLHMSVPSQVQQLPYVPLDQPLPAPTLTAAPAAAASASGSSTSAPTAAPGT